MLFNSPYFPANNSDIIAMHFLRYLFNEIVPDTFEPDNICMDYYEKTCTKLEARNFAPVISPDYLLVIFLILNALIDVSEDPHLREDVLD